MNIKVIFIIVIVLLFLYNLFINNKESFTGAFIQMTHKSPIDNYLTFDTYRYNQFYPPHTFIWNNATRMPRGYGYPYWMIQDRFEDDLLYNYLY
jgi:hypothetical protein